MFQRQFVEAKVNVTLKSDQLSEMEDEHENLQAKNSFKVNFKW